MPPSNDDLNYADEALELARETIKTIEKEPKNYAAHRVALYDLNSDLALACQKKYFPEDENLADLVPALAAVLPPFSTDALYEKRQNLVSMAGLTLIGWFLGGALSGLLSLVGMGGDILRVAAVFAMFWFSEYLSSHPRSRKIILGILGLSGLTRMATSALGGFIGINGIRQAIFGMGKLPNIFKASWLFLGSFFVFVFLARKVDGLNIPAFEQSLADQVESRLRLVHFVLSELGSFSTEKSSASKACNKSCPLVNEVLALLDGLPEQKKAHLVQALRLCGINPHDDGKWIVWDDAKDRELYEPVGLVKNGDRCLVLEPPLTRDGKIIRGRAQRMDL